jgi:hypothetical protein
VDHDEIEVLRRGHPAWRLLRADNAALVLGFLGRVFVEDNAGPQPAGQLIDLLDDQLYAANLQQDHPPYPKPARAYLDDWAGADVGWLRKFYPPGSDEPCYDATAALQKAYAWVTSLQARPFVGTESRLSLVVELLRQIAFGAEEDPDLRLAELHRRRDELDAQIARAQAGQIEVMSGSAQRDRYQQFAALATELLADFREVEANFRGLDRELRVRITTWDGSKGDLLEEVVGSRSRIDDSDEGSSFRAFYDFLLSASRQDELDRLLAEVQSLEAVQPVDRRLRRIHHDWLDAAERTQATVRVLSEQLRRFLDDQVWLENRRVVDLVRSLEQRALAARAQPPRSLVDIDDSAPSVVLPMERPLYAPRVETQIDSTGVAASEADLDTSAMFEQVHVDRVRLTHAVRASLRRQSQVGLPEVLRAAPLEQGLAELIAYLSLEDPSFEVVFDAAHSDEVVWDDPSGRTRVATLPKVTFARVRPHADVMMSGAVS